MEPEETCGWCWIPQPVQNSAAGTWKCWCGVSSLHSHAVGLSAIAEYSLLSSNSCLWQRLLWPALSHQVLEFLLCRWKSGWMVLWTWCKAICSQRKPSVNFASNLFSGAGPTSKNSHSHKKLAPSQTSVLATDFSSCSIAYLIPSMVNNENQIVLLFQDEPNRVEFVLFSILRLPIFILQWKSVPSTSQWTSDF